jgi:hypothetical protein
VFGTLFVYGPDGRPRWYSASAMTGHANATTAGPGFYGTLAESTGPVQPGIFYTSDVRRREVGTIAFETYNDNTADLSYVVDGVNVKKRVQRLTMKAANATGEYVGFRSARGCGTGNDPLSNQPATLRILQSPSSFTMSSTVLNETCTYSGVPEHRGRITGVKGTFSCTGQTPPGTFEITNMNVTYQGFIARLFTRTSATCTMEARFSALSPRARSDRGRRWIRRTCGGTRTSPAGASTSSSRTTSPSRRSSLTEATGSPSGTRPRTCACASPWRAAAELRRPVGRIHGTRILDGVQSCRRHAP